jgi:hypothetical protein
MAKHFLQRPLCCQNAERRLWPNCSKGFKSVQATFLLHQITWQDCLWAYDGVLLFNALSSDISERWELEFGIIPRETVRKTGLSGYCITLDFWKNSFYSSYTLSSFLWFS